MGSVARHTLSIIIENKRKTKYGFVVYFFTMLQLLSGTSNTISFKIQGLNYNFRHGMLQTALMFLGESANLYMFHVPFLFNKKKREQHFLELKVEAKMNKRKIYASKLLCALPSLLDAAASTLQNVSLLVLPASVSQLLIGGNIITMCIVSSFLLKRKIYRHHLLGNVLAFIGLSLAGISSLINDDVTDQYSTTGVILGIIMVVISVVLQGFQANIEEIIMIKYELPVQRLVGLEGLFGVIWTFAMMMASSYFM